MFILLNEDSSMVTLTPAYGRDYKTSEAVIADFESGKDFILRDISSIWDGRYTSIRDWSGKLVKLRFNNSRDTVIYQCK